MTQYQVTAPEGGFNGESCGVVFRDGAAVVSDGEKSGRAAIEYFRRRGYTLTPEGADEAAPDGPQEPGDAPPAEPFDPSKHPVDEVLAYLDSTTDEDEIARVIAAERDGKNRKTITDKEAAA